MSHKNLHRANTHTNAMWEMSITRNTLVCSIYSEIATTTTTDACEHLCLLGYNLCVEIVARLHNTHSINMPFDCAFQRMYNRMWGIVAHTSISFLRFAKPTHNKDDFELSTLEGSFYLSLSPFCAWECICVYFISQADADISDFFGFMREHFTRTLRTTNWSLTEANCFRKMIRLSRGVRVLSCDDDNIIITNIRLKWFGVFFSRGAAISSSVVAGRKVFNKYARVAKCLLISMKFISTFTHTKICKIKNGISKCTNDNDDDDGDDQKRRWERESQNKKKEDWIHMSEIKTFVNVNFFLATAVVRYKLP